MKGILNFINILKKKKKKKKKKNSIMNLIRKINYNNV